MNNMARNVRLYLWAALAMLLYYDYQAWQRDYGPPPAALAAGSAGSGATSPANDLGNRIPDSPAAPAAPAPAPAAATAASTTSATAPASAGPAPSSAPVIHVHTDVLDADISTQGGTLERVDLLKYPKVKGEAAPVRLENHDEPATLYALQSGLTGPAGADYPTHLATFTATQSDYTLGGESELKVPLSWNEGGVEVVKTFVFRRGAYAVDVDYAVKNGTATAWTARPYAQILRNDPRTKSSMFNFNVERYAYHGPAMWDGTKYRKLDPTDAKDSHLSVDVTDGWVAALQHHFVSAIVPPARANWHFGMSASADQYLLSATGPQESIAPGATGEFASTLYVGPKLAQQLDAVAPNLDLVADYGRLSILAKPLFQALSFVHRATGNWGVAIILVTFLLKLVFYPLSESSGRSMAKMKTLQPRMKQLQETYADDREKLGRAMMELYKREKVNPAASCLPILIQIPVFLAFYWVLLESVEMRQAPFAFWIHDLSSRDPYFVLPALMAIAMFVQYRLNPAPPDPVQAKVFMIMPLVMSATFAFFPSGLVLYWVTNTVLSIAQQWNINRRIAAAAAKKD
jgi:YidC/Oxa1 family membrane protein insertase